jgi:hypothetical protein
VGYVKRGAGRSHSYHMCLPKRLAAALQTIAPAAGGDDAPPFVSLKSTVHMHTPEATSGNR